MGVMDERDLVAQAARRHGLSEDATRVLWQAMRAGGGFQAQFSHPDLGGMGQWSNGMLQIGDMFNSSLKARVLALCADLAALVSAAPAPDVPSGSHQSQRQGEGSWSMGETGGGAWWPDQLGAPSSTGAQNETRYALFPASRRLAILRDRIISIYDTGDHRISGFSQQQGTGASMVFTSQHGPVSLDGLRRVGDESRAAAAGMPVMSPGLTGGCFCGAVRYEAGGTPFHETLCHCRDCRRVAGAPAVAWFSVARDQFRFTAGEPKVFRSSERAVRRFCSACGTALTFEADAFPREIDITTASLDDPDAVPPRDHCYARSAPSWDRIDDRLPIRAEPPASQD